jgi:hypothetical protein
MRVNWDALCEALGVEWGGRLGRFVDPDGNTLAKAEAVKLYAEVAPTIPTLTEEKGDHE